MWIRRSLGAQIHYQIGDVIQCQHEEAELDSRASREQLVVIKQRGCAMGHFIKANKDVEELAIEFGTEKKKRQCNNNNSVGDVCLPGTQDALDSIPGFKTALVECGVHGHSQLWSEF